MVEILKQTVPDVQIGDLIEGIGAIRVRPLEVLAGAACAPPPADFDTVAPFGGDIERKYFSGQVRP
jgi:hypothetical protein